MANSFSLLRLPNEERLQVLRCMDRMSLLHLSLLSLNTKNLVRSLRLTLSFSLLRLPSEERLHVLRCMDARSLLLLSLTSRKTKDLVKASRFLVTFRLLRLPNEEQLQVLRCMDARDLLLLSLISRKTKDLVKSVQIKPSYFHVSVGEHINLQLYSAELHFYKQSQDNMRTLAKPTKVRITAWEIIADRHQFNTMELPNSLEIRDWYQHILCILNLRQAKQIGFYQGWERFDLESIKKCFGKIHTLVYRFVTRHSNSKDILNTFVPDIERVELEWNPYPEGETGFQKMMIQNFDSLDFGLLHLFEKLYLEDLLISNARYIKLRSIQKFEGTNQFLKLWIKGGNPRLRKFSIGPIFNPQTQLNPEEVLKGIKSVKEYLVGEEIVYEGKTYGISSGARAVDIKRYDGTRATVLFRVRLFFDFLVWA